MTRPDGDPVRVLVPLRILEGETVGPGVLELLSETEVVLLGYHVVPDQTPPGQARMSFEDRAQEQLADVAAAFETAGASVETTLVFTPDAAQTLERVADEEHCDAVTHVNPAMDAEDLLVVLHGDVDAERIGRFVARLVGDREMTVVLLEVGTPDAVADRPLTDRARTAMADAEFHVERVKERTLETNAPVRDVAELAGEYDATVLGEKEPSLAEFLLGGFEERIARESMGPVLVVRSGTGEGETDDPADETSDAADEMDDAADETDDATGETDGST